MKKLLMISVSALALSAGAALAQNTNTLNQIGSTNQATINQTLNDGAFNTSTVNQGGWGINGNGNDSLNGIVSVTQIGGNASTTSSTIDQNNTGQSATVIQDASLGGQQTSTITQSNNPASGTVNNVATVTQTTSGTGDIQESTVTQTGKSGYVSVTQKGPSDKSTVTQNGNNNNATDAVSHYTSALGWVDGGVKIIQGGSAVNTSTVTQSSDYSGIAVTQDGATGTNGSEVDQWSGSGNTAGVWQTASGSISNSSLVTQAGTNNLASVRQH